MTEEQQGITDDQEVNVDISVNLPETICFSLVELQVFVEAVRAKTFVELAPLIPKNRSLADTEYLWIDTLVFGRKRFEKLSHSHQRVFNNLDWERDNLADKAFVLRLS